MSLYRRERSPFWWYDFTYQGKRYRDSTGERTKAAAATMEANLLADLSRGIEIPSKASRYPTLREFSARFLLWSENSHALTPASKKFYRYGCRLLLFSRLSDTPMNMITSERVECTQFQRPVIDRRTGQETSLRVICSPAYTNQALRTLKAIVGKAVEWDVIRTRHSLSTMKAPGRDKIIDTDTEIQLQEHMNAPTKRGRSDRRRRQAWLVMVILQDTGMRPDEVFPMEIEHIHWDKSSIWVPKGKTPKARRFVGMSARMRIMLEEWCKGREGWVFPSKRSASGHLEGISKGFAAARKRGGIDPRVVPYSARHTYGTFQMQATGNVFAVSKSMGHANVKSMEPYQHPDTSELNTAIDKRNQAREARRFEILTLRHTARHTTSVIQ